MNSQAKTNNEQGYTPSAGEHYPIRANASQVCQKCEVHWPCATALAAHRVTLATIVFRGMVRDERRPFRDDLAWVSALDTADDLLASGVVTVGEVVTLATPAETDDPQGYIASSNGVKHTHEWTDAHGGECVGAPCTPVASQGDTTADEDDYDPSVIKVTADGTQTVKPLFPPADQKPVVEVVRSRGDEYVREQIAQRRGQKPAVPVDALGFPTQEGATFTGRFAGDPEHYDRHEFVITPGYIKATGTGLLYQRPELDPASIEDISPAGEVRPADEGSGR